MKKRIIVLISIIIISTLFLPILSSQEDIGEPPIVSNEENNPMITPESNNPDIKNDFNNGLGTFVNGSQHIGNVGNNFENLMSEKVSIRSPIKEICIYLFAMRSSGETNVETGKELVIERKKLIINIAMWLLFFFTIRGILDFVPILKKGEILSWLEAFIITWLFAITGVIEFFSLFFTSKNFLLNLTIFVIIIICIAMVMKFFKRILGNSLSNALATEIGGGAKILKGAYRAAKENI